MRSDETTRWVRTRAEAQRDAAGNVIALRGTSQDITDRKLAEQALSNMSRRLVEAQEQERARIARDLHDDINQRLALTAIGLKKLSREIVGSYPDAVEKLDELSSAVDEISADVQTISHQLHPSKLQFMGLVPTMRGFVRDFANMHSVTIGFTSDPLPANVPNDVALTLFRVLQEALHNAAKHSGADQFTVSLTCRGGELSLSVGDPGIGFDLRQLAQARGLGLVSMRERIGLVNGTMTIDSKPSQGTTVCFKVPLGCEGERPEA
jgi:signal transduction histidine kinase